MTKDMTRGPLLPLLGAFTLPLILGNILQLTYNAADSIIVGRCVGPGALAAVGTTNPLMTLVIMAVQGISLGAGILIGSLYGAKRWEDLRRQVSTGMLTGLAVSALVSFLVLVFADRLLVLLRADPAIRPLAAVYLRIIACGFVFNFTYNYFASTLRAMGDSRTPLLFLALSSLLNICGDLFLVLALDLGVTGCGLSTVLSEFLSSLLCCLYIRKRIPILDMGRDWLVLDRSMLRKTLSYGTVSAVQQSTVQLGIVGVQGCVNSLGANVTAAFAAANRIDDFALIPGRSIANAMTAVMAQNHGAGRKDRVRRAFLLGMGIEIIFGLTAGVLLLIFSTRCIGAFTRAPEVIREGETYLRLIALMYVLPAFTNGLQGYFRGIGDLKVTLASSIINMGTRFLTALVLIGRFHRGIEAVPFSCLAGWVMMILIELPYLLYVSSRDQTVSYSQGE